MQLGIHNLCISGKLGIYPPLHIYNTHIPGCIVTQGRIQVWTDPAPAPSFWQVNHSNSAYFGAISANFDTRPPLFANPGSSPGYTLFMWIHIPVWRVLHVGVCVCIYMWISVLGLISGCNNRCAYWTKYADIVLNILLYWIWFTGW